MMVTPEGRCKSGNTNKQLNILVIRVEPSKLIDSLIPFLQEYYKGVGGRVFYARSDWRRRRSRCRDHWKHTIVCTAGTGYPAPDYRAARRNVHRIYMRSNSKLCSDYREATRKVHRIYSRNNSKLCSFKLFIKINSRKRF